jgi:hypothetical protein
MNKIIDYKEYLLTKTFEAMDFKVKELELILSPRLLKILKEMNHQIATDLLAQHVEDARSFKVTFVDLGSEPGDISFIQANKVPELIEPELVHGDYHRETEVIPAPPATGKRGRPEKDIKNWKGGYFDFIQNYKNPWITDSGHIIDLHDLQFKSKDHPVWTKFRAETSIGRFINTIWPKKYPVNMTRAELAKIDKPIDIESFSNMFKATVEAHSKILKFVSGEDFIYYYNCDNYAKEGGTLGGSCMNSPSKGKFLKIYANNPEKIKMLVLYPEDVRDKIIGRAIVWTLDSPEGRTYMDRIYTANDSDQYLYIEYAKSHGYLYKSSQSYGWKYDIIDGRDGSRSELEMKVQLKPGVHYDYYPYLDTMQFYNPKTGIATNAGRSVPNHEGYYLLQDSTGGYSTY